MSSTPLTSTGRGGAGNIGHDTTVYTDGGIVHEGYMGESTAPEYSAGRGGAGNIVNSPAVKPVKERTDQDYIPETSLREGQQNYHTGRGGQGNVHKEKHGGHSQDPNKPSVVEQVKEKVEGLLHHNKQETTEKR